MGFNEGYQNVNNVVLNELDFVESKISTLFENKNPLEIQLTKFLTNNPKRLRPLVGILFAKAMFGEISESQLQAMVAIELIHNATLIHDDVIDSASFRRSSKSLNCLFNSNLAVVAGDYLLSIAMEKIINLDCSDLMKLCTSTLKNVCDGEINQYFNKYKIMTMEKYIEKSEENTALLFELAVLSGLLLKNADEHKKDMAVNFAKNFGIAFQIRDDLLNFMSQDSKIKKDFSDGIYTAPIIFANEENNSIVKSKNLFKEVQKTKGIEKTKSLMDNYLTKSELAIVDLDENIYKNSILKLTKLLREGF